MFLKDWVKIIIRLSYETSDSMMDLLVRRAVSTAVAEQSQYIAGSPW